MQLQQRGQLGRRRLGPMGDAGDAARPQAADRGAAGAGGQRLPRPPFSHPARVRRLGRSGDDAAGDVEAALSKRRVSDQVAVVLQHRLLGLAEGVEVGAHGGDRLLDQLPSVAVRACRPVQLPFQALLPAGCQPAQRQPGGAEYEARPGCRLLSQRVGQLARVALLQGRLGGAAGERPPQQRPGAGVAAGDRPQRLGHPLRPIAVGALQGPGDGACQQRRDDAGATDRADGPQLREQADLVEPGEGAEVKERRPIARAGEPQRLFAPTRFRALQPAESAQRRVLAAGHWMFLLHH